MWTCLGAWPGQGLPAAVLQQLTSHRLGLTQILSRLCCNERWGSPKQMLSGQRSRGLLSSVHMSSAFACLLSHTPDKVRFIFTYPASLPMLQACTQLWSPRCGTRLPKRGGHCQAHNNQACNRYVSVFCTVYCCSFLCKSVGTEYKRMHACVCMCMCGYTPTLSALHSVISDLP